MLYAIKMKMILHSKESLVRCHMLAFARSPLNASTHFWNPDLTKIDVVQKKLQGVLDLVQSSDHLNVLAASREAGREAIATNALDQAVELCSLWGIEVNRGAATEADGSRRVRGRGDANSSRAEEAISGSHGHPGSTSSQAPLSPDRIGIQARVQAVVPPYCWI